MHQRSKQRQKMDSVSKFTEISRTSQKTGNRKITYPAFLVFNHKHKPDPPPIKPPTLLVQRTQTRSILLKTIHKLPILRNPQPLGDHVANLLRNSTIKQARSRWCILFIAVQNNRIKRRGPKRARRMPHGIKDAVDAVFVGLRPRSVEGGRIVLLAVEVRFFGREAPYETGKHGFRLRVRRTSNRNRKSIAPKLSKDKKEKVWTCYFVSCFYR